MCFTGAAVRSAALLLWLCAASPVYAQVQEAPPQRWDTDTVKQMLREIEIERDKALGARAQKDDAAPAPLAVPQRPQQTAKAPLIGLSVAAIAAKLGVATLARKDGKVQLLQYLRTACVLDVFFYDGLSRYIEARSNSGANLETNQCLRKQLAARGISLPESTAPAPSVPLPAPPLTDLPAAPSP
jgi:hypothetical protein